MLSPYANSAVLASKAVKQTYKGLIAELYSIHNGALSKTTRKMYTEVSSKTKSEQVQDLALLNERFAEANNYLVLLKNIRIQQELIEKYGKGEVSIERAAHNVGLQLPIVPEHKD